MFSRKHRKKIESVPLKPEIAEARALAHSRAAKKYSSLGNIASARYHAELANFLKIKEKCGIVFTAIIF